MRIYATEENNSNPYHFKAGGKQVTVYPGASDSPVIYLNTFAEEGDAVYQALCRTDCPGFTLVTISGLFWNHDMSPWSIPPIARNDTPCTGGADAYLRFLESEIMPQAEKELQGSIPWRGIAGYSLAGLFALYTIYRSETFSRVASVSGSLWFPGLLEYARSHEMKCDIECIYFSLGDKEHKTRNPYLKTVQDNTEKLVDFYKSKSIHTIFQLNPGSHFQSAAQRTAAGIASVLCKSARNLD